MTAVIPRQRMLPRLLCLEASRHASGIVVATRGRLKRLFCLEDGWIAYATSNLIEEQFLEVLVRKGVLDPSRRAEIAEEAAGSGQKATELLRASDSPSLVMLQKAMEELVEELLASSLEWPDGDVSFEPGRPRLDDEVTVRVAILPFLMRHARRFPTSLDAVRVRIGPPDVRPARAANAAQLSGAAEFDVVAHHVIASCDGERELGALLAASPYDEGSTLRAVHGLLLSGILEPNETVAKPKATIAAPQGELTREECLTRLRAASAGDHYGVLGLERLAPPAQVREAYYALARRYHPDRFRSGTLQDLLGRFEAYFSKVTEAYNTLSEPGRRREYDDSLVTTVDAGGPKPTESAQIARQNFLRGRALAQARKWNDATTFLENAARLEPGNPDYNLEAGLLLIRNPRRRVDAERYLLRTIEISPAAVKPYLALGQMYARAGHPGPSARMLREVLRWDPNHSEARTLLDSLGPVPDVPASSGPGQPVFTR